MNQLLHKRNVLSLYKKILKVHEQLPLEFRAMGDMYARVEFRRHKDCDQEFIPQFMEEWIQYYNNTAAFAESQDKSNFKGLTEEQVDIIGTNESQTGQLYEMMQEAQKTKTQFLMVEEDGNPHDSGKKE